jgi:hypothetical protein
LNLTPEEAAKRLTALADRVRDLRESRRSPHVFHEEKSELYDALIKLAEDISGKPGRLASASARPAFKTGVIAHKGRIVDVQTRGGAKRTPTRTLAEKVFA